MKTVKLVILFIMVFLVGASAGSLGTRLYLRHELSRAQAQRHNPQQKVDRIVARLTDDLKLDKSQEIKVRKILIVTQARATGVKNLYAPELKKIYDLSFQNIGEHLTAKQQTQLEKRHERFTAKYNAMYFKSLHTAQTRLYGMAGLALYPGPNESERTRAAEVLEKLRKKENLIIGTYEKQNHPDLMLVKKDLVRVRSDAIKDLTGILTGGQIERFKRKSGIINQDGP